MSLTPDLFEAVRSAAARLKGWAHVTPVLTSRTLDRAAGASVFLKCENFQKVGAFKFRGAYNAISRLSEAEKRKGVLTLSSGNHSQAVALVGSLLGVSTTVLMPSDAPPVKRRATEAYGARVVTFDPRRESRDAALSGLLAAEGGILIPPFDHPDIIAGQGTAALEMMEAIGPLDSLLVPCGGGGLLSGSAVAAKGLCAGCRVFGVEPEAANDATLSFRTGVLHTIAHPATIADGTRTPSLGRLTFPLIRRYVDGMTTVPEPAIREAVRFLFERMKLVVEPSGALGVAALLSGSFEASGRVGVILSGGNIDPALMADILTRS